MVNIRYRINDGELLEANYGPVAAPGVGEAIIQYKTIPDFDCYMVVKGKLVERNQDKVDIREQERAATERELALARLYANLAEAQKRELLLAEGALLEQIERHSIGGNIE